MALSQNQAHPELVFRMDEMLRQIHIELTAIRRAMVKELVESPTFPPLQWDWVNDCAAISTLASRELDDARADAEREFRRTEG
jgi:hypothetical protein